MPKFNCTVCDVEFDVPQPALDKYPGWEPKYCRDHSPNSLWTATHEQYWLGEAGGKKNLINKINALSTGKWDHFKFPLNQAHNKDQETDLTEGHFLAAGLASDD